MEGSDFGKEKKYQRGSRETQTRTKLGEGEKSSDSARTTSKNTIAPPVGEYTPLFSRVIIERSSLQVTRLLVAQLIDVVLVIEARF